MHAEQKRWVRPAGSQRLILSLKLYYSTVWWKQQDTADCPCQRWLDWDMIGTCSDRKGAASVLSSRHRHGPVYARKPAPRLRVWIGAIAPRVDVCSAWRGLGPKSRPAGRRQLARLLGRGGDLAS